MSPFFITLAIAAALGIWIVSIVMSHVASTTPTGQYLSHGTISPAVNNAMIRMAINICLIAIAVGCTAIGDKAGSRSLMLLVVSVLSAIFTAILTYEKDGFGSVFAFMSIVYLIFGVGFFPSVKLADFGWTTLICTISTILSILVHKNAEKIYGIYKSAIKSLPEILFKGFQLSPIFFFYLGMALFIMFIFNPTPVIAGLGIYSFAMGFLLTFIMIAIAGGKDRPSMVLCFACTVICAWLGTVTILL